MAYYQLIPLTPAQLANITDEVTACNAAYMQAQVYAQIADIITHLERPGMHPRAIFSDTFGVTGPVTPPPNWTVASGIWTENAGVLNYNPVLPSPAYETIYHLDQPTFNSQNYQLAFHIDISNFTVGNAAVRLEFRRLDANNVYYVRLDENGVHLRKVVAGVDQAFPAGSYALANAAGLNNAVVLANGSFDFVITADWNDWEVFVNSTQTHDAVDTITVTNQPWFDRGSVGLSARDVIFTGDNYVLQSWVDGV